ncbi:uncharacterized protein LOC143234662 isoform X2 [Tachypleus tridentatus]|uniref:uncharacterized protein LOC143234662 isoform X2 n=1 Tax=Tachypleus tridentatus TaxID=6853 RepID=UPI003FD0CA24
MQGNMEMLQGSYVDLVHLMLKYDMSSRMGFLHLYIFSSKDIKKDQEITIPFDFNYQENNLTVDCPCGKQNCAVTSLISSEDKQNTECSSLDNSPRRKTRKNSINIEDVSSQSQSRDAVLDTSDENAPIEVSLVKDVAGEVKQDRVDPTDQCVESRKKMTREERKLDAIMRAFERMENSQKKKQQAREKMSLQKSHNQQTLHKEEKTKHQLNGEVEESTPVHENKNDVKRDQFDGYGIDNEEVEPMYYSTPVQHAPAYKKGKKHRAMVSGTKRRIRTSSGGSGSEILSPDEGSCVPMDHFPNSAVSGTLASPGANREGFVLPKSKRFLMNEWMQEKAEAAVPVSCPLTIHTELSWDLSTASPTCYVSCTKDAMSSSGILAAHLRRNNNSGVTSKQKSNIGSAKKRWLRQAMCETTVPQDMEGTDGHESETSHCSPIHNGSISPNQQSEASNPCLSPSGEVLTPLKKRRMMRASKDSTCSPILDDHPVASSPEISFGMLGESFRQTVCGIKSLASDYREKSCSKLPNEKNMTGSWLGKEANVKGELRSEKLCEENSIGTSLLMNCTAVSQVGSVTESSQGSCLDVYDISVDAANDTLQQSLEKSIVCISGENISLKCDSLLDDKCSPTKYNNVGGENISLSLKDTRKKVSVYVPQNSCYIQEIKTSANSDSLKVCYTDHNPSLGVDKYVNSSVNPITLSSEIVSLCSFSPSNVISSDTSSSLLSHPVESVFSNQDLLATLNKRSHKTGQKRKVSLSEYRMRKRENNKNETTNLALEIPVKYDLQNSQLNDTDIPLGLLPLPLFEPLLAQDASKIDFKVSPKKEMYSEFANEVGVLKTCTSFEILDEEKLEKLSPGKTSVQHDPKLLTSSTVLKTNGYVAAP